MAIPLSDLAAAGQQQQPKAATTQATLASLVRRRLLDEPRGMMGHEINDAGLAALEQFAA